MKESGFMAATVPEAFGGLGLVSGYDLAVGLSRLARIDGSTAIAANMHLSFGLIATRQARGAREIGDDETAATTENFVALRGAGSNDVVYDECVVPENLFTLEGSWGEESVLALIIATAGNIGLVASFLGIAEAARDVAVEMARSRRKAPSGRVIGERRGVQHL